MHGLGWGGGSGSDYCSGQQCNAMFCCGAAISAARPARIPGALYWPQQFMNDIGQHPFRFEMAPSPRPPWRLATSQDGITDGVISNVSACAATLKPQVLFRQTIARQKLPGCDPEDTSRLPMQASMSSWLLERVYTGARTLTAAGPSIT
ncbi:uncharacterized protein B0I36DRAFT_33483 [Microdochium trichocladiopsis]|uniref:Uncharacterized protein n=1 Tax=Microdochium trichocladiopsis TaxID=1682393 RepID=A0A9P8XW13_9PEZI|nr:uncharacterized protein B0I36DRAFT_33483 [Microdochium trichocladiopsis]KAH7021601.1 hypothetical protein B0I36DRAFT_33483 [Microdochium trichocladiopsis]